jgi:formylglycine-generating enzyme required for sulfatase activity
MKAYHLLLGVTCFCLLGLQPNMSATPEGMVRVKGGTYQPFNGAQGDRVEVSSFYMDVYPVTNADYLEFVRENPQWRRSQVKKVFADEGYLQHWAGDLDLGLQAEQIRNGPVTNVSWFAARAYAAWRGKRLPTLDEWEFAAQASAEKPFAGQDPAFVGKILDWYSRPKPPTHPSVGKNPPNFYAIYDLHGLVWEWVLDFNSVFTTGDSREGGGINTQFYCAAGSATASDTENYAAFMRFAFRGSLEGDYTVKNLGFRCAKDIP